MKKDNNWIICLLLAAFTISCNKDILDQTPLDKLASSDVLSDANLSELFVNGIYTVLPNDFICWDGMLDEASDDGECAYNWAPVNAYNIGDITPQSDNDLMHYWSAYYTGIRKANLVIQNIDAAAGDADKKKRLKGEATFLRAYAYFDLIRTFGSVPLITKPLTVEDDLKLPRNTMAECIDFVVTEAAAAAALLPPSYEGADIGRATSGAALALKAKILIYAASPLFHDNNQNSHTWSEAAAAAQAVIDLHTYSLPAEYTNIWKVKNNSEIIFDRQIDDAITANMWDANSSQVNFNYPPVAFQGWGGMSPTQELVDSYEMIDGLPFTTSPLYDPKNPYLKRDPRFKKSIIYEGNTLGGRAVETRVGGTDGIDNINTDVTNTGYYMKKFIDEELSENPYERPGQAHLIYLRYAGVLLDYAEAKNEASGPDASIYKAVNDVRTRAGMPDLPAGLTKDQMRARIRNERRVEMAFETERFYDIRRWKIAENVLNGPMHGMSVELKSGVYSYTPYVFETRIFPTKLYFMPIPQSEIDKNEKLVQNPGYN